MQGHVTLDKWPCFGFWWKLFFVSSCLCQKSQGFFLDFERNLQANIMEEKRPSSQQKKGNVSIHFRIRPNHHSIYHWYENLNIAIALIRFCEDEYCLDNWEPGSSHHKYFNRSFHTVNFVHAQPYLINRTAKLHFSFMFVTSWATEYIVLSAW